MNAQPDSTDSPWWKVFFTPVGPRLVVGRPWRSLVPRRRVSAAADFIDRSHLSPPVKDLVKDVVRRTRLWNSEKMDVAGELVAHFEDALQVASTSDEVTRRFGDPAQAARLIRRAKKRNRSLYWRSCARASQATLALIAIGSLTYGILIARYLAGIPLVKTDYASQVNSTILAIPDGQRAWPIYREAFLNLSPPYPKELWHPISIPPIEGDWSELAPAMHRMERGLNLIREAAKRPYLGTPLTHEVDREVEAHYFVLTVERDFETVAHTSPDEIPRLTVDRSSYLPMHFLANTLQADARLALLERDEPRFVANLTAMLGLANQYRRAPLFVDDIFSFGILISTVELIHKSLSRDRALLSEDHLTELAHRLGAYGGGGAVHIRYDIMRTYFADDMQRMYTDDGNGDGRITSQGLSEIVQMMEIAPRIPFFSDASALRRLDWLGGPAAMLMMAGRREVIEEFERQLTLIEAQAAQPMWTWKEVPGDSLRELVADEHYGIRYLPLSWLPDVGGRARDGETATQRRDAALTAIALELYRRRHGAYPARLDDLVPNFLPALPIDRFDGQPLRYLLTDDGPLLYSVGADRIDDGGAAPVNEEDAQRVAPHWFRIPADPMNADWILWDGRRQSATDAP